MDEIKTSIETVSPDVNTAQLTPIGPEQLKKFTDVLLEYRAGRVQTEKRIIESENWWKLRNALETKKETGEAPLGNTNTHDSQFKSQSGWLHNVIVSKHADAMDAYPEPAILPREAQDKGEAKSLSQIIPCVLEQNKFEKTYSDVMWQKLKTGTGVYKVSWDADKLGGLGDISVERVNLLNVYWEPTVTDIQESRYLFNTEVWDKEIIEAIYPQTKNRLNGQSIITSEFRNDEYRSKSDKATVIDVYYHKYQDGKKILHYCKYVDDIVLYATENETEPQRDKFGAVVGEPMSIRGLYDHGRYPYVFDPLFPVEGSPCGYGFVDLCRNPQMEIDLLKTSFVRNAMAGSVPRYFARGDGGINEKEFLDLTKPIVHTQGNLGENDIRVIEHNTLDSVYVGVLDRSIQELRETSGNTETSTGNISSGVTAASAIAALQQASGKGSRDSTLASYRAYSEVIELCIELIRQFYDAPRNFRILGTYGTEQFITYENSMLKPQHQGTAFDEDMGFRLPVFDIKISAQKKNAYTKVSQNELALQFFQLGFFNPQMTDQALMCLEMMDFEDRDTIMQKIAANGTIFEKLLQYMKLSLAFAQVARPDIVPMLSQDIMQITGGSVAALRGGTPEIYEGDNVEGYKKSEPASVEKAKERSGNSTQPDGGRVIKERK